MLDKRVKQARLPDIVKHWNSMASPSPVNDDSECDILIEEERNPEDGSEARYGVEIDYYLRFFSAKGVPVECV